MDPIWGQLLLQVILIAINAFFAATEIAVISLNGNKLKKQAEEGDKKAKVMLDMIEKPAGFLSTIQIGITLAGFLGSAFAAENFSDRLVNWLYNSVGFRAIPEAVLNTISVIFITLILSYFTLVFGELVPKRIAMQKPDKVARISSGVVKCISIVMKPVIWLLSASTNGMLRLLRMSVNPEEENVTEDEIRMMVDIGEESGAIESAEKEMIENIFEFNNTTARDVMTHRTDITAIWKDDSQEDIVKAIEESGLSRFPVYDEDIDDIIGILSTRVYLLNMRSESPKPLMDLIRPAYFVPESLHTDKLFRDMQTSKNHIAIVIDEYGGTSGLVTMEDLLEEIVGNIYDEFDPLEDENIKQLEENLWRAPGSTEIEALSQVMNIEIPEDEEYDTLGGLIFSRMNTIPEDGSQPEIDAYGMHIKVEELSERRVEWALISKIEVNESKAPSEENKK